MHYNYCYYYYYYYYYYPRRCPHLHFLSRQLDAVVLSPLPYHQCGHDER